MNKGGPARTSSFYVKREMVVNSLNAGFQGRNENEPKSKALIIVRMHIFLGFYLAGGLQTKAR